MRLIKFALIITSLFTVAVFHSSCDGVKQESESQQMEKDLDEMEKNIQNLEQTMGMVDAMQLEIDRIEQMKAAGSISEREADQMLDDVKDTYGRMIAKRSNQNPATGLPNWARALGLSEPRNMVLDADFSQLTSASNPDEGFNSVLLVYNGSYEVAMEEAKRIANQANIPISKDFQQAAELAKTYSTHSMKGIAYMNFDPFVSDAEYNISITVDELGTLTISAVDMDQMRVQFEDYEEE